MKPSVNHAYVTEEFADQCPQCGGPMQPVPYFSAMVNQGGTHREMYSLTKDKIVTTYNLSFITPHNGGYCPACSQKSVEKENENIRENNKRQAAIWDSLSEKERKARRVPGLTIAAIVFLALSLLMVALWMFGALNLAEGIAMGILFLIIGVVLGLGSWASNDGLFPLVHNPSQGQPKELYDAPGPTTYTAEELSRKIVDRLKPAAGVVSFATRQYYTPGDMQRLRR